MTASTVIEDRINVSEFEKDASFIRPYQEVPHTLCFLPLLDMWKVKKSKSCPKEGQNQ
jgi:hypothetical protein